MKFDALSTPAAVAYRAAWHVKNPVHETEASIQRMLSRGNYTPAEAKEAILNNPDNIKAQHTYELWANDVPCYLAKDVHAKLLVVTPFAQWRYQNGVPIQLAAWQAAYLLKALRPRYTPLNRAKQLDALFGEPEETYNDDGEVVTPEVVMRVARHPQGFTVTDGSPERAKTKVGRVYGSWRVVEPLSSTENTAGNNRVMYRCACTTCGDLRDLSYHSIANTVCKTCKTKQWRATKMAEPIILYINAKGQLYKPHGQNDIPQDAVGFCKISEFAQWTELVPVSGKILKSDLLLVPLQDYEGPVQAKLKEAEPEEPTPVQEKPHDPHDIPLPTADDLVGLDELPDMEGF